MSPTPEDKAREVIDGMLEKAGWHVCDYKDANIQARLGVVMRNFPLKPGHGTAIRNLEKSLTENRPRALIQMATGSGKTFTAVTAIYRMIKFGGAKRVLFLVDRANLGRQTLKEFQQYASPYSPYQFTEEYIVLPQPANLTLELCRALPVPLPPLVEQKEIVNEVARDLSVAGENEIATLSNLQRGERLRHGILKEASARELIRGRQAMEGI